MSEEFGRTAEIVELGAGTDLAARQTQARAAETLEAGGVLLLRERCFELTAGEREMLLDPTAILRTRRQRESKTGRPTVILDPRYDKIVRSRIHQPERAKLEAMMVRFRRWAEDLVAELLPQYAATLTTDRVTFRPCRRSATQGLHVDSSYGSPTQGRSMLRVFCNIDPGGVPRVWQVGEPFEPFARRFLPAVKPKRPGPIASLLARAGITNGERTEYDLVMAGIRAIGKGDESYQETAPRRVVEFPAGSTWIAITDLVLHGAMQGQHSLDQTFYLPAATMTDPSRSSLRILERLSGRRLA